MPSKTTTLILGHSFVRRFKEYVSKGNDDRVKRDLDLHITNMHIYGVGGRTIQKLIKYDLHMLSTVKPDIVILELGTNDLASNGKCPDELATEMITLVDIIHSHFGIKHVVVCQVIERARPPTPTFNANVVILNDNLQRLLRCVPHASFWHHRGLRQPTVNIFVKDGVHLNQKGLYALYRSYRGAILKAHKIIN